MITQWKSGFATAAVMERVGATKDALTLAACKTFVKGVEFTIRSSAAACVALVPGVAAHRAYENAGEFEPDQLLTAGGLLYGAVAGWQLGGSVFDEKQPSLSGGNLLVRSAGAAALSGPGWPRTFELLSQGQPGGAAFVGGISATLGAIGFWQAGPRPEPSEASNVPVQTVAPSTDGIPATSTSQEVVTWDPK